ncbi:MAG TPA: VCBS repeat-containing protein [Nocardioidaceae bacterium]|nr:VCBS repeat-containing protein [Nocardioidaceae bacterium]
MATLATSPAAAVQVIVTDVAKQAGVFESNKSWSACESGDLLYVGGHQLSSHLYQSNGAGLYESLPLNGAWPLKTPSARADRHGCAWADFDLNGLADMYNTTGRNESNFVKPDGRDNELWLQTVPGLFTDVGTALGLGDPCTRGRHAAAGDLDGDGWADIVEGVAIGRDDPSDPCNIPANGYPSENPKVYLNLGADPSGQWQGFAAGQDLATDDDPGQRGVELFDVDRDGDLDILGIRLKSKTPVVYVNDGSAGFTAERKTDNGLTTAVSDASRYDVDGDGDLDLVEARKTSCGWQPADGFGRYGKYKAIVTFSGEGRSVAIGRTAAGLAVYCQVQADSGNPTDYVGVLSGTTWAKYTAPAAAGLADEVYAIHPDSSGNVQFLVLNGGNGGEAGVGGPVQLVKVSVQ